jgi:hypothetical protein
MYHEVNTRICQVNAKVGIGMNTVYEHEKACRDSRISLSYLTG